LRIVASPKWLATSQCRAKAPTPASFHAVLANLARTIETRKSDLDASRAEILAPCSNITRVVSPDFEEL